MLTHEEPPGYRRANREPNYCSTSSVLPTNDKVSLSQLTCHSRIGPKCLAASDSPGQPSTGSPIAARLSKPPVKAIDSRMPGKDAERKPRSKSFDLSGRDRYHSRNDLAPHFSTAKRRNFQPRFTPVAEAVGAAPSTGDDVSF